MVVAVSEQWGRSLPGLVGSAEAVNDKATKEETGKLKIRLRYERLGEFAQASRLAW